MRDRSDGSGDHSVYNKNYENDIHRVLQMCQWFLRPIGIWPLIYSRASKRERILSTILIAMCTTAICFVLLPCSYYLLFQEKDFNIRLELVGPLAFCGFTGIKYSYMGLKSPGIRRCLQHILNDWKVLQSQNHRDIMMENVAIGKNLTKLLAAFLYTGGVSYHTVMPLLSVKNVNENITIRQLAYPGCEIFLDVQSSPVYEILLCVHCFTALIMYTIATSVCGLVTIFVTHACGQIQLQMVRLKSLISETKRMKRKCDDPLILIVADHVSTLRFSKDIEEVLRELCLLEIVTSTFYLCLSGYLVITGWRNGDVFATTTHSLLFISVMTNILTFCYIGELLIEQCRKIGISTYEIEWYELPDKKALDLILLIAISNYPSKLTAGRIFDLSLTTFSNVVKSSMAYFNLLRTFVVW